MYVYNIYEIRILACYIMHSNDTYYMHICMCMYTCVVCVYTYFFYGNRHGVIPIWSLFSALALHWGLRGPMSPNTKYLYNAIHVLEPQSY